MAEGTFSLGESAADNRNLALGLVFLEALVSARVAEESGGDVSELPQPSLVEDASPLAELAQRHSPSFDEYTVLLLALAPHLQPSLLESAVRAGLEGESDFPQFGGRRDRESRALIPTAETACFLLAGEDLDARLAVQQLFSPDHWLAQEGILRLEEAESGAPLLSGRILMSREWVERLTLGRATAPAFSSTFPARRIRTELEWDDLVLEPQALGQIEEVRRWLRHHKALAERAMPPGRLRRGFRALFHGPPGTGKTLAAGLLGKVSDREVYRVDLSCVVSKYIGETEKNLAALFETAQHRDWILFFDEADALFGKRTAIRDAHDRYANQEVSYLLQRVEDYDGLAILASNLRANMDDAFLGRFDALVRFPMPGEEERRRIWLASLPRDPAPQDPEAFAGELARFELSGRAIVGALHFAALAAIDEESPELRLEHALRAIRREMEKEGRVFRDLRASGMDRETGSEAAPVSPIGALGGRHPKTRS